MLGIYFTQLQRHSLSIERDCSDITHINSQEVKLLHTEGLNPSGKFVMLDYMKIVSVWAWFCWPNFRLLTLVWICAWECFSVLKHTVRRQFMSVFQHQSLSRPSARWGGLWAQSSFPHRGLNLCVWQRCWTMWRLSRDCHLLRFNYRGHARALLLVKTHHANSRVVWTKMLPPALLSCVWATVKIFAACLCPLVLSFTFSFICIHQLKEFLVWVLQSNAWEKSPHKCDKILLMLSLQSRFRSLGLKKTSIAPSSGEYLTAAETTFFGKVDHLLSFWTPAESVFYYKYMNDRQRWWQG